MSKFLIKILLFTAIGVLLGESIVRVFQLSIDVPEMYQGSDHLIKYRPNQTGNYMYGDHQWVINKYGNYGYEPPSLDSLITVIGDSYISNVMNPPKCHQANFLAHLNDKFNFYPNSRDGASFIEFMEMKKNLRNLKPIDNLLFVHHGDFIESITELGRHPNTVQLSIAKNKIRYAHLTTSPLKAFIYNFKFAYFLYRNFLAYAVKKNVLSNNRDKKSKSINYKAIQKLLDYTNSHYRIDNVTLVFSPDTDRKVIALTRKSGFKTLLLKAEDYKSWQLKNDSHWSCEGHKKAAIQVNNYLETFEQDSSWAHKN